MMEDREMEQKDRKVLKRRLNSLNNDRKQALARYQRAMDRIGQCMEAIGGHIEVTSTYGEGTCFTAYFQKAPEMAGDDGTDTDGEGGQRA